MTWQIAQILSGLQGLRDLLRITHPQMGGMTVSGNDICDGGPEISTTDYGYFHLTNQAKRVSRHCDGLLAG
jgi:hypothetical protein